MITYLPILTYVVKIGDTYFWDLEDEAIRVFMTVESAKLFCTRYQNPESMRVMAEPLRVTMERVKAMGDVRLIFSHCHPRALTDAELLYDPDEAIH